MRYRAFVAATKKDLEKQREHVTKQLRDAGLEVDPMENWPADAENPAVISAKRASGCHFCIALVGFQRGTIAHNDMHERSITQLEVDTAISRGLKTLVYLLRDSEANRRAWPPEFNQIDDPQFAAWRRRLEKQMVCGYFDAGSMPDVLPAVTRQIVQWEQRRRRRHYMATAALAAACVSALAVFVSSADFRNWTQSHLLAFNDPIIFQNSQDGLYKVARLLDGRSDIVDNTKFREEIRGTRVSFDLFANTFGSFRDYYTDFEDLVRHKIQLRFVLTDFSDENHSNWEAFNNATEALTGTREETLYNARNIRELILALRQRYPGTIKLRLNQKPIFYTLWIRDPSLPSAMAHLGITYYGQKSTWPAFRMSSRTGAEQLASLHEQFELIWSNAKPENHE